MSNKKKIAIVTGGSKGIGQSISIGLSEKNIDVIITYLRDKNGALTTLEEIKKAGSNCYIYKVDLSKEEQVEKFCNNIISDFDYIDYIKLDTQAKDLDIIKSAIDIIKDKVVWITAEGDGGYYNEENIKNENKCNSKNIIKYMTKNNFIYVNHPNTNDPTFYNKKYEEIKDSIFIYQH